MERWEVIGDEGDVAIIAILEIGKTTLFYEGKSVVYDGFKYVWPVKG